MASLLSATLEHGGEYFSVSFGLNGRNEVKRAVIERVNRPSKEQLKKEVPQPIRDLVGSLIEVHRSRQ